MAGERVNLERLGRKLYRMTQPRGRAVLVATNGLLIAVLEGGTRSAPPLSFAATHHPVSCIGHRRRQSTTTQVAPAGPRTGPAEQNAPALSPGGALRRATVQTDRKPLIPPSFALDGTSVSAKL